MNCDIIIPNFNGKELLQQHLPNLLRSIPRSSRIFIHVVDNGSQDGSVLYLKSLETRYTNLEIHALGRNSGFSGACNWGASYSEGEVLVFLNNDCTLSYPVLEKLYSALSESVVAVQPVILTASGNVENCGFLMDKRIARAKPVTDPTQCEAYYSFANWDSGLEIFYGITAACLAIRRDIFRKLGGFDESFHSYLEDIDLSIRIAKARLQYRVCTDATVVHQHLATSSKMGIYKQKRDFLNWIRIIYKHYSWTSILKNGIALSAERLRNLNGIRKATPMKG
ncbi:MAG: glycosyltransferase [Patescibacteria group bacterium]|nr:glycosyltransferase [Patescibacteria group bacterium]